MNSAVMAARRIPVLKMFMVVYMWLRVCVSFLYHGVCVEYLQVIHSPGTFDMPANDNRKELPEAAKRALAEAQERREKRAIKAKDEPAPAKEILGRDGPDPVRFGDWEKDGIVSDF